MLIMKLTVLIILQFLIFFNCSGQKKQYWPFGNKVALLFENGQVSIDTFCQLNNREGTSSVFINDSCFFYSDGKRIFNKLHHQLNFHELYSENSSTQGSVMLMHPDNDSTVFMFTNSAIGNTTCPLYYYEFNITSDTSLQLKYIKLLNLYGSEKLSVVNHKNNRDMWLITHSYFGNEYFLYLITQQGLIQCPVINAIGTNYLDYKYPAAGQIKFSTNGEVIVCASIGYQGNDILKFDSEFGNITDSIFIDAIYTYGAEISPNNKFIYLTDVLGNLMQYQIDPWNNDSVINSKLVLSNQGAKSISALQLAINKTILWSNVGLKYMAAIEEPNKKSPNCNLNYSKIYLNDRIEYNGLPTFNQSEFYTPSLDFKYNYNCVTNTIDFKGKDTFNAGNFKWLIKKTSLTNFEGIYTSKLITHHFNDTGVYQVTFIASISNRADTVIKSITIHPKLKLQFLGNDTAYPQGSSFNLTLKTPLGMHCQMWQDSSGLSTFNVDTAGIYVCKITNKAFCQLIDTIVIKECINTLPVPVISRHKDTLFSSVLTADSFVWYRGSKYYKTTLKPYVVVKDTGSFNLAISKQGFCKKYSNSYPVKNLKIHEASLEELGISYFPNPSSGVVFFRAEQSFNLRVFDAIGQEIGSFSNPESIHLNSGVYCLQFDIDGVVVVQKLVVLYD